MSDTQRVVMMWPTELKEKVRDRAGKGGITEFTIKAVKIHLGIDEDLGGTVKELNEVKFFAQQLADQLVLGVESPEERLQTLMEVEFPAWIDTSGWPKVYADRVRPKPFHEERADRGLPPVDMPTCPKHPEFAIPPDGFCPECKEVEALEVMEEVVKIAEDSKEEPAEPIEEFVPKHKDKDDLFARVMAKTGGALADVPGLKVASDIPRPEPVTQKDLCGKCGEELVDGECWTCG